MDPWQWVDRPLFVPRNPRSPMGTIGGGGPAQPGSGPPGMSNTWLSGYPDDNEVAIWRTPTQHALLLQGESYDGAGNIARSESGPRWINIACAGAALSKMRLLGFHPQGPSTERDRQATLKMLTARYHGERTYTWPGVPLLWKHNRNQYYGVPRPETVGPMESVWSSEGAECTAHPRLWLWGDRFREAVCLRHLTGCSTVLQPSDPVPGLATWTTFTVGHAHDRLPVPGESEPDPEQLPYPWRTCGLLPRPDPIPLP
jgi:hypothetical protein